ncbi:MAG: hypothetical protein O2955_02600 [Planctomycetota bacterium]|nr:hypothetical protein [Planctomycetota bacterium]MDA1211375.1 hypothetical protein [Planctomycetota bacterium]
MPQQPQLTPQQYAELKPETFIRTMQIIAGALMMGVILFGGVVAITWKDRAPAQAQAGFDPMLLVLFFFTAGALAARFTVPQIMARHQVSQVIALYQTEKLTGPNEFFGRLMMIAQTKMIIEYALVEGVCFFALVAAMTTHSLIPIGIVVGLLLLMASTFPTKNKLLDWLEEQRNIMGDF